MLRSQRATVSKCSETILRVMALCSTRAPGSTHSLHTYLAKKGGGREGGSPCLQNLLSLPDLPSEAEYCQQRSQPDPIRKGFYSCLSRYSTGFFPFFMFSLNSSSQLQVSYNTALKLLATACNSDLL